MNAGSNRWAKAVAWRGLALSAALVLLGACGGDREDGEKATQDELRREGQVTIGGDLVTAEQLTWRRPIAVFDPANPKAAHRRAAAALARDHLFEDSESAIPLYLALLDFNREDGQAALGLERALERLREAGDEALLAAGDEEAALRRAHAIASVMRAVEMQRTEEGAAYLQRLDLADELWALNEAGERALADDKLGEQGGDGALPLFRKALTLQPGQARAMQGVAAAESALIRRAEEAAVRADFVDAERWLAEAEKVRPGFDAVDAGREQVEEIRRFQIALLRDEGLALLARPGQRNNLEKARELLAVMLRIAPPGDASAKELRTRIDMAAHYGLLRAGQRFTDALQGSGRGPRMVVVPHGAFRMGARDIEPDASGSERPSRYVRFDRGFAISVTETTVGEFRRFLQATGHEPRAERRGHSLVYDERGGTFVRRSGVDWRHDHMGRPATDDMPVLHVSAKDAEAYARWLSERSGQRYRLPSEAEFEYVLRSGQPGRYPWGDLPPTTGAGNLTGGGDRSPGGRNWGNAFVGYHDGFWGPAPVARFRANAFGAHDMEGNVSEWVADCWHDGYRSAPIKGEAWLNPGCRTRVVRGGAWSNAPSQTRAAWRRQAEYDSTHAVIGFRVAREI